MSTENKPNIQISDIDFSPVGESQLKIIAENRNRHLMSAFYNRVIGSVILIAVIMICEYIGRYNGHREKTIPGMFISLTIILILFNILSFGYVILKKKLDFLRDHMSYVNGEITDIYNSRFLQKQNKQKSKNYILFDTEANHCITAVAVTDPDEFNKMRIGQSVMIVKSVPYGDAIYRVYPLD